MYFDSDHAHDQVTRWSVSGVVSFVGPTPISWTSKRQGTIESSSYSTEFFTDRVASEEAIAMRYMLRSFGVPIIGATSLCGNKLGMIISSTKPDSELNKNMWPSHNTSCGSARRTGLSTSLRSARRLTKPTSLLKVYWSGI